MVFITVRILDNEGNLCPNSDNLIHFEIEGNGELVAVGNGNAATTAPFQSKQRKAFSGKCMVYIKATTEPGKISLEAKSEDLISKSIQIQTKK
jgi:beta-galactosidase